VRNSAAEETNARQLLVRVLVGAALGEWTRQGLCTQADPEIFYARRVFRPACDGRYLSEKGKPGKLVIVDGATWPGRPVASWAPAGAATPFEPPSGSHTAFVTVTRPGWSRLASPRS
jgi:hypothetical protein